MTTIEERLEMMFVENTGRALCDSGDVYGRAYERNQINHPRDAPEVSCDEYGMTVNTFHHLRNILDTDSFCDRFNELNDARDNLYEGEMPERMENLIVPRMFTVEAFELLSERFVKFECGYNTYECDCPLDHYMVVNEFRAEDDNGYENRYILINLHLGCDIRGGYGISYLFKEDHWEPFSLCPSVWGTVKRGEEEIEVCNDYDGCNLRIGDTEERYEFQEGDIVDLRMAH